METLPLTGPQGPFLLMEENIYVEWLRINAKYLNLNAIELKLKLPQSTLRKFASGERPLPAVHHVAVEKWVKSFVKELPS